MTIGTVIALIKALGSGGGGGGSGGGVLVVNVTYDESTNTSTCDKTADEMAAALESGGIIFRASVVGGEYTYFALSSAYVTSGAYRFETSSDTFQASSPDEYPASHGMS